LNNRSFVTGASGLLGSWLVKELLAVGDSVVVLQRDAVANSPLDLMGLSDKVTTVTGDVCDGELLERILVEYEVESVFHLAAQTVVGAALKSPVATYENNVAATWRLLDACRRYGEVKSVVVASSDKAYGSSDVLPYTEAMELKPSFPYDVSKACTDLITHSYGEFYGLPTVTTRCANIYGGGDLNGSRLVPESIAAVLSGRPPVLRSDGSPERDFIYVEDVTDAYLKIREALVDGQAGFGQAYNIGTGKPVSVLDLVSTICKVAGSDISPEIQGSGTPNGEIDRQWIDATKLTDLTGWKPSHSLEEGIGKAVDWYRSVKLELQLV